MLLPSRFVIDGAMATELERRGADLNHRLWSARVLRETPALVAAVHADYLAAGADVLITASYQATFAGFAACGIDAVEATRLLHLSVGLAQRAVQDFLADSAVAGRTPRVAASIGAFGAWRHDGSEYRGDYGASAQEMRDFHRQQLAVLAESGADLVAFETLPSLAEGEAVLRLLEEFPEVPAWLSFSCAGPQTVCHGERFADCAALANEARSLVAVGVNCSDPRFVESLLRAAAAATAKPLIAYPNRGTCWNPADGRWTGDAAPASLAEMAPAWLAAGASGLGGCCGSSPADIAALASLMR